VALFHPLLSGVKIGVKNGLFFTPILLFGPVGAPSAPRQRFAGVLPARSLGSLSRRFCQH